MAEPHNPYATPKSDLNHVEFTENGPWRDGKLLVVRRLPSGEADPLPRRCLKCNQPGSHGKPKTYVWSNPALILLVLVPCGLILLLILYFIFRKTIKLAPVFCERHERRRRIAMGIGWVGPLLSLGLLVYGGTAEPFDVATFGLGWLFVISTLISISILNPAMRPSKIDEEFARFRDCGPDYLNSLPPVLR